MLQKAISSYNLASFFITFDNHLIGNYMLNERE